MINDKQIGLLTTGCLLLVMAFAVFYPQKGEADEHGSDVPPAPALEEEGCGWSPACWKEKFDAYRARDAVHAVEDTELRAAYAQALGEKKYFNDQLEDLAAQNGRDVLHFEQIISEQDLAAEAERLHSESLEAQIKALTEKDGRLRYIEGCFIPIAL